MMKGAICEQLRFIQCLSKTLSCLKQQGQKPQNVSDNLETPCALQ